MVGNHENMAGPTDEIHDAADQPVGHLEAAPQDRERAAPEPRRNVDVAALGERQVGVNDVRAPRS
jgi:hypothetical protein